VTRGVVDGADFVDFGKKWMRGQKVLAREE
jgi:hypothetical protein